MVPFAFIQFFSGTISDLFNRQSLCVLGLLINGLGAFLVALAPTFEFMLGARVIQGVGYGLLFPVLVAAVGDLTAHANRGKIMGGFGSFTTAGIAFGPLIAGFIVPFGWEIIFYLTAGISFLTAILFWKVFRGFPAPSKQDHGIRELFAQVRDTITWNILLFCIIGFAIFLSYIGINVSIGDRYSMLFPALSEGEISYYSGIILSLAGISGILVAPLAGILIDKAGRKRTAYLGGVILSITLSLFILGDSFASLAVLFFSMGMGSAIIWAAVNTITVELDPSAKGTVSSISSGFRFLGYSFASPLYIVVGLPKIYFVAAMLAVSALILLGFLRLSRNQLSN
jgi:MFS family permease